MKKNLALILTLCIILSTTLISFVACDNKNNVEDDWWNDEFEGTIKTPEEFKEMIGGFACGVCHPNENYEQILDANIGWVRFDISYLPFDKDGNLTPGYLAFKERAKSYADRGIKVMGITPYPEEYIDAGLDPRDEANWPEIMKIARFYVEDLQGIVSCFQITNEMGIPRFTEPLNDKQARDFIGIQLKAMYRYKKNTAVGFNCGGIEGYVSMLTGMKKYLQYADYVGMDFYLGCFDSTTTFNMAKGFVTLARNMTGLPVMINEFGYMGYGEPKTDAEKIAILESFGAVGETLDELEEYVLDHPKEIMESDNFPQDLREELEELSGVKENMTKEESDAAYALVSSKILNTEYRQHIYKELSAGNVLEGYPHNPTYQAKYMEDTFEDILTLDYLCGTFVYCYSDSKTCYVCGQENCPVETGWGLVDGNGDPKPLYYSIQEIFGEIRGIE